MSKVTIALGSFIIGACFVFTIVPGNASTFARRPEIYRGVGYPMLV